MLTRRFPKRRALSPPPGCAGALLPALAKARISRRQRIRLITGPDCLCTPGEVIHHQSSYHHHKGNKVEDGELRLEGNEG